MCVRQQRPIFIFGKSEKYNRNDVRVELREIIERFHVSVLLWIERIKAPVPLGNPFWRDLTEIETSTVQ